MPFLAVLQRVRDLSLDAPVIEVCDAWEVLPVAQVVAALRNTRPSQLCVVGSRIPYARSTMRESERVGNLLPVDQQPA